MLFGIFVFYDFLQVEGERKMRIGKISSLPAIMHMEIIILPKPENTEKLPVAPTRPKPGPILLIAESTAVKVVSKS